MAQLRHVATLTGGAAGSDPIVGLESFAVTGGVVLQAYTATGVRLRSWEIGTGPASATGAVDPGAAIGVDRIALALPGGGGHQLLDDQLGRLIAASDAAGAGSAEGGLRVALDGAGLSALQVEATWIETNTGGYLYLEDPAGGLVRYTVSDAALAGSGTLSLSAAASYDTGALDDMLQMRAGGHDYVITVGAGMNGPITVWQVGAGGALTETGTVPDGQGVGDPSAAVAVSVAGVSYLAVAGQGSGSISVYQLTAMGGLIRTDHVLDDNAQTRFNDISILETASAGGRSYLVAAGSDQGITLLELLPGGRLLHRASFGDTEATALASVSAVELVADGDRLQIFATSASEGGVSQFVFDPGALGGTALGGGGNDALSGGDGGDIVTGGAGADTLAGGAGDDVLMDGAGSDQMSGGTGADIFVMAADAALDTITDFDLSQDRIDLSAWNMLYDVAQLTIQTTTYGARILWRDEELRVMTQDRAPISAADFSNATLFNLDRPPLGDFSVRERLLGDDAANRLVGAAPNLEIFGMAGNDVLVSRGGNNLLIGGEGIDMVDYGGLSEAVNLDLQAGLAVIGTSGWQDLLMEIENVLGGAHNDVLAGDTGANVLRGEAGSDSLMGGFGDDELIGGTGADTLRGDEGDDTIFGNTSTDLIYGGAGNDALRGGDGVDQLWGGTGDDFLIGHKGWDVLRGEGGNDVLYGSSGADQLWGGADHDQLNGGTGVDTLRGGSGNDTLYGNAGADPLYGDAGNDALFGGSGVDTLWGGADSDTLYGNEGADDLRGDAGADDLRGGTGDDSLTGGSGNDTLYGNQGNDTLAGGAGNDVLRGGTLPDTFVFTEGRDEIEDFRANEDRVLLDTGLWSGTLSAAQVIDRFGGTSGSDYVLDFGGGHSLTFQGGVSEQALEDVLFFI